MNEKIQTTNKSNLWGKLNSKIINKLIEGNRSESLGIDE